MTTFIQVEKYRGTQKIEKYVTDAFVKVIETFEVLEAQEYLVLRPVELKRENFVSAEDL